MKTTDAGATVPNHVANDPKSALPAAASKRTFRFDDLMQMLLVAGASGAFPVVSTQIAAERAPEMQEKMGRGDICSNLEGMALSLAPALERPPKSEQVIPLATAPAALRAPHPTSAEVVISNDAGLQTSDAQAALDTFSQGFAVPKAQATPRLGSRDPTPAELDLAQATPFTHAAEPLLSSGDAPASGDRPRVIGKLLGGADRWSPPVSSEFSAKRASRADSFASMEKAWQAFAISSAEQAKAAPSPAGNCALPMQGPAGSADQIKDAVLARTEDLRNGGRAEIHVRLHPPELGEVRVHLVTAAEQVTGRVVVQHETVRAALESQMPELRQRLEQAGVALGRFDVTQQDSRRSGNWQDQRTAAPLRIETESVAPLPWTRAEEVAPSRACGRIDILV